MDFTDNELNILSSFLEDGKSLFYFGSSTMPKLSNFYNFLNQWGIIVYEGKVFESDPNNHITDNPFSFGSYQTENSILSNINYCITSDNQPISVESRENIAVTSLVETNSTTTIAPKNASVNWNGGNDKTAQHSFSTVISSVKENQNNNSDNPQGKIIAFSSISFIDSEYIQYDF